MKQWMNQRTVAFLFWLLAMVIILLTMPDLNRLIIEKGQLEMPEDVESELAAVLQHKFSSDGEATNDFIVVFHQEEAFTEQQQTAIRTTVEQLVAEKKQLGIIESLSHIDSEQAAKQLVSEDGTTILTQLAISKNHATVNETVEQLYDLTELDGIETYVTGSAVVIEDFTASTQEGIKKTEVIAVIFILAILVIIFRSPIVPLMSLLTVGVAYIVSLGIVAHLVDKFDMAFSNFTQIFLVVILFGIGTDYNILIYSRFKEELTKTGHVLKAIAHTYTAAGKTVVYSGVAVMFGFLALYFAEFKLYQATAPVAIGVAVLLLVLLTLNPFLMSILGFKMFWPIKTINGHEDSKIWGWLSRFSFARPVIVILFIVVFSVPAILKYSGELNYNDLVEMDDKYLSKQAINIIAQHYPAGMSAPVMIYVDAEESLATQQHLKSIDELAGAIESVEGVAQVYTVTRPEAKMIDDLYTEQQSSTLQDGIVEATDGVAEVENGLSEGTNQLNEQQDTSGVQALLDGTKQLQNGSRQLTTALQALNVGLVDGVEGAEQLTSGIRQMKQQVEPLVDGLVELEAGYKQLASGFSQFEAYMTQTAQLVTQTKAGYSQIVASSQALSSSHPELQQDENLLTIVGVARQALEQLTAMETQSKQVAQEYSQLVKTIQSVNDSFSNAVAGAKQLQNGLAQLETGASTLQTGISNAQSGTNEMVQASGQLQSGLGDLQVGHETLNTSLQQIQADLGTLASGLTEGADGLAQIQTGLASATSYLDEVSTQNSRTFYIPEQVLTGDEFADSIDMYMTDDKQTTKLMVILEVNPYTGEAMKIGQDIREAIAANIQNSSLQTMDVYMGGKTSVNIDLQQIAKEDFIRSALIMLVGIGFVLLIITRSIFQVLVVLSALMITTFTSLGLVEWFNSTFLSTDLMSWNVPFFSLIMIVALGVDYSIFLLMRFNELKEDGPKAIVQASRQMGGVILAAAVILGGTFAALIPSGIITLIQVALVVVVGLLLLSFVMMPMYIPAMMSLHHKLLNFNWKRHKK